MADEFSWKVLGPLAGRLVVTAEDGPARFRRPGQRDAAMKANARLILHRTAVARIRTDPATGEEEFVDLDDEPVRTWAVETYLGRRHSDDLAEHLALRRAIALDSLASATGRQVMVVELEPQGALVTGTANAGIRDVGIELHGTYGWPVIPGSGLKGVAAAYAAQAAAHEDVDRIFGLPRPCPAVQPSGDAAAKDENSVKSREPGARPGSVVFFDALPGPGGVTVARHDLTPHAREYHTGSEAGGGRPVPAEYLNPVPIPFLVVDGGTFVAHLIGPAGDAEAAARLLCEAVDDLGIGAKTSAGYGYATATCRRLELQGAAAGAR